MLDLTDFAVQEQPADNLMVAISRPWYNGPYAMAAKPIKSLELHYTMIQFLIISISAQTACDNLRAADWEYRELAVKTEISDFLVLI